jgi:hypothetical protein
MEQDEVNRSPLYCRLADWRSPPPQRYRLSRETYAALTKEFRTIREYHSDPALQKAREVDVEDDWEYVLDDSVPSMTVIEVWTGRVLNFPVS